MAKRPFDTFGLQNINGRIARLKHRRLELYEQQLSGRHGDVVERKISHITREISKTKELKEEWLKWALGKHYIPPHARYTRWPRKSECLVCWRNRHGRILSPAEMIHVQRHRPI